MTDKGCDGFDVYNGVGTGTGLQAKWSIAGASGAASMQTGRFAGQCVRYAAGGSFGAANGNARACIATAVANGACGFAMRVNNVGACPASGAIASSFGVFLAGAMQFGMAVTTGGGLILSRNQAFNFNNGNGVIATATGTPIVSNTWHYVELVWTIHNSTGACDIYVDGVRVLNATGLNIRQQATATWDGIGFGAGQGSQTDFDDVYWSDTNTKLGERKVETIYPTSDVNQGFARSTGSTNYTLVDEAQANGDTDYVQGTAVNDRDTYGLTDLGSTPTTIDLVQVAIFAEKTDATARSIAAQVISGGTTSDGANFALTASYTKIERVLLTDPNTSAAWTGSGVNALTAGPKVTV